MKIVNSPQSRPPVTVEFTNEEARLLHDLAGWDATIPESLVEKRCIPDAQRKQIKDFLQNLRQTLGTEL